MKTLKTISLQTQLDYVQVDQALKGNQQAYRILFKRYWKQVLFKVNKMIPDKEEAQDIAMGAFSKAFIGLHRFRKEYGFKTWLYRVAINHSLDHLRRNRIATTSLSSFIAEDPSGFHSPWRDWDDRKQNPEELVIQWQNMKAIQIQVQNLPAPLPDIARMRFMEAYSYEEIARMRQMPLGTVKSYVRRSRLLLQQALKSWYN